MATNTPNLKLVKPEITDKIDVSIANFAQNADKIDREAKRLQDRDQALQSSLDNTKEDMTVVQNGLVAVNQQLKTNKTAIDQIHENTRANSNNVTRNTTDIGAINERTTSMQGSIHNLTQISQENKSTITFISSEIEGIKKRLTALEGQQEMPPSEGEE
ncbi:hypothetical protein [Virgibacillus proomii]|uniref:hypothetical protein n=1 Tax=Virgibacillus proomii TaxID=84407 RepID=UPI000987B21D|nr:hypothetical protein [Virgibacillus proomii]